MDKQAFIQSVQADLAADLRAGRAKLELAENMQGSVLWARLCKVPREPEDSIESLTACADYWDEQDARRAERAQWSEDRHNDNRRF